MTGLCSNVHLVGLLLDDRHGHRASRTIRGDPVVKITQLAFPLEMGRDRPKSLYNLSQDLIAVTAGATVMKVVAMEFISAIEGNDWLSIRVAIHKQQPTVIANKIQPNLKGQ